MDPDQGLDKDVLRKKSKMSANNYNMVTFRTSDLTVELVVKKYGSQNIFSYSIPPKAN